MNADFLHIIAAAPEKRQDLFLETASRLDTSVQNIEKDFWLPWY